MALLLHLHHRLPLLLAVLVAASHGVPSSGDSYDPSMCLKPQLCGEVNISYPFYLSDETGVLLGNSSSYCSYPGLGIKCDGGNQAVLELGGEKYVISSINNTGGGLTVTVVDKEVLDDQACPKIDHNVALPPWFTIPNTSVVNYIDFFLDCYFGPEFTGQRPDDNSSITCSNFIGPKLSFVFLSEHVPFRDTNWWLDRCQGVFQVPVLKGSLGQGDPQNDPGWTKGGFGKALLAGFPLAWDYQKPQACVQCEGTNGQCGHNQTGEFVACLCSCGRVGNHNNCTGDSFGHGKRTKLFILAFFLACKCGLLPTKSKDEPRIESFLQKNGNLYPKRYTYADLKRMTRSFSVKLGQGGFGDVYRGNLSNNGCQIAVKMLKGTKGDGEEFMNEVASISRTSHVNIVTLLGYCFQGSKRALIYEYMPNGSLERYAFNSNMNSENMLSWEKLFDTAIGIARGLEYLHRGCSTRIVHFDIKPHNVLLDQDFCPKISDFGLAKLCMNKESAISITGARGTIGYIAPEVYSKLFGTASSKSDVYSYGMMVLEMVGARDKNINADTESSSQYFPQWIYEHVDEYCISASEINGETTELVRKMIVVGLWCIQVIPTDRPTMTRVVEMLEGNTSNLELPPKVLLSL
ncbi:unnamed protein product [Urochloa decumbens]|uniref:Protein kinase domain-containing protein n=1 Tax=Urochloa decumbens TaxID=240449 RepID=A0ABC8Z5D2_9POAL